jgi:methylthioribose-1-phosphate isomerase
MPTSTFDTALDDGLAQIEIEFRSPRELTHLGGMALLAEGSPALNPAFDVTPARLVSAFITERGVFAPAELARGLAHV